MRLYLLVFYGVELVVFSARVVPASLRVPTPERQAQGMARLLPPVGVLFNLVLPPVVIVARAGEMDVGWLPMRWLGFGLSMYAATMMLWAAATLGRFLVPQAVVLWDHSLVVSGPYRLVRHPAYSGDLALFLGAGLATANALLVLLWPIAVLGTYLQTRQEDALLASKFGAVFERYARTTSGLFPRLGRRSA
jgi:protein-S-isoprenylcysteine O-methyltransferase